MNLDAVGDEPSSSTRTDQIISEAAPNYGNVGNGGFDQLHVHPERRTSDDVPVNKQFHMPQPGAEIR